MARWEQKTKVLIGLVMALAVSVAACGDDSGNGGGNLDTANPGQLLVMPIGGTVFDQVAIGEENVKQVTIQNSGTGTLRITNIKLHENSGEGYDGQREFWQGDTGWEKTSFSLEPGAQKKIAVKYIPKDQTQDKGALIIESNDPNAGEFEYPLSTQDLAPQIYSPPSVTFQRVPPQDNDPNWRGDFQFLRVENTGSAPLNISDAYVNGSDRFYVTFPDSQDTDPEQDGDRPPSTLAPGESFQTRVWFKPDDNLPEHGELIFESNDPDNAQYAVDLVGNSGAPCLQVVPGDEVNFGQGSLGQVSQKTVTLENCSRSEELEIDSVEITDDGGGVYAIQDGSLPGTLPDATTTIAAGERANFVVTFEPDAEQDYTGELVINSNDTQNNPKRLPINGEGSNNACPHADAKAWIQGTNRQLTSIQTIPLKTVQFDGSASNDPDGSVARYEWTILSRPQGSTQRLLPNNSSANPRLFLDLAGTYEIELKVYDDQGASSCGDPAIITINATPDHDVHVQLVWDTPSDSDQTDNFGTDLDLHYLHPNGRWDNPPWDIFWRNTTADWGVQGNSADDPTLDIDDTDGAGPENVNHSGLENLNYKVGVYYYSDSTLGASYATVRIYIQGRLDLEIENKYMPRTGSFWDVAIIHWRTRDVQNVSRMYQGFP